MITPKMLMKADIKSNHLARWSGSKVHTLFQEILTQLQRMDKYPSSVIKQAKSFCPPKEGKCHIKFSRTIVGLTHPRLPTCTLKCD